MSCALYENNLVLFVVSSPLPLRYRRWPTPSEIEPAGCKSAVLPPGLPFGEKDTDASPRGLEHHVLDHALARVGIGFAERYLQLIVERLLADGDRGFRFCGDQAGHREDLAYRFPRRDDPIDKPVGHRLPSAQRFAQKEHFHGT